MSPAYFHPWVYLPAAAAFLGAVYLLYRALLFDRSTSRSPRPRCPKCWYDLSGAPSGLPITCPECGRGIASTRELHRTRRRPVLALIALPLLALLPAFSYFRGDLRRCYYALAPRWATVETLAIGKNTVTLQRIRDPDDRGMRVIVSSGGKPFLTVEDINITFGNNGRASLLGQKNEILQDLDRDGDEELIISMYSGGAHCCYTVYILELTDPPQIAATIDGRNGIGMLQGPSSKDVRPQYRFNVADQSFDYWNASHADSAFASVYYRFHNHHLEIELDRMLKPMKDHEAGRRMTASQIHGALFPAGSPLEPGLWHAMLDLIYSGNEQQAWDLFDAAWPPARPGKAEFKAEFLDILNKSPQYRDFKAALAAQAQGNPIPPALVGQYIPEPLSTQVADPKP